MIAIARQEPKEETQRPRYYLLDGIEPYPVTGDVFEWAKEFEEMNVHVGDDMVGDVRVSTVFLGLDRSFGKGPPLLFETMVFGGELDGHQDRYSTWHEAEEGHERARQSVVLSGSLQYQILILRREIRRLVDNTVSAIVRDIKRAWRWIKSWRK